MKATSLVKVIILMNGHDHIGNADYLCATDIDECLNQIDSCEQNCHNINGSYTCSCDQGFLLQDEISCIGKGKLLIDLLLCNK